MGELHLEIIVERMKREFNVLANTGQPQVAYKETIKKVATAEGKYIRQSGGRGQYGHCFLRVEPKERGVGLSLLTRLEVRLFLQNLFRQLEREPKKQWRKAC